MIASEVLEALRRRYGAMEQICGLCGLPMSHAKDKEGKTVLRCFNSPSRKYSTAWWDHYERSTTSRSRLRDPMVMQLIEEYERMVDERSAN